MIHLLFTLIAFASLGEDLSTCPVEKVIPFASYPTLQELSGEFNHSLFGEKKQVAAIYGPDTLQLVDVGSPYPYTTMGKLYSSIGSCTATLVSACHVLVSRHCVTGSSSSTKQKAQNSSMSFQIGYSDEAKVSQVHIMPGNQKDDDVAIIRLNQSLGKKYRYMEIESKNPSEIEKSWRVNKRCYQAGYPADLLDGRALQRDTDVSFYGPYPKEEQATWGPNMAMVKVDAFVGSSGGPFFCIYNNGKAKIWGLLSTIIVGKDKKQLNLPDDAIKKYGSQAASGAVASSAFANWANNILTTEKCP